MAAASRFRYTANGGGTAQGNGTCVENDVVPAVGPDTGRVLRLQASSDAADTFCRMTRPFSLAVLATATSFSLFSCSTASTERGDASGVQRPTDTAAAVSTSDGASPETFSFSEAVKSVPAGTYRYEATSQIEGDDEFSVSCDVDVVAERKRCVDNTSLRGEESIIDGSGGVVYTSIGSLWPAVVGPPPEGVLWVNDGPLPAGFFVHPFAGFERFGAAAAEQVGEMSRDGETLQVFAVAVDDAKVFLSGLTDFNVEAETADAKFYVSAANVLRGVSFEADTVDGPAEGSVWLSTTEPESIDVPAPESVLAPGVLSAVSAVEAVARQANAWSSMKGLAVTGEVLVQAVSEIQSVSGVQEGVTVSSAEEIRASNCVEVSVAGFPSKWHITIGLDESQSPVALAVPAPGGCVR